MVVGGGAGGPTYLKDPAWIFTRGTDRKYYMLYSNLYIGGFGTWTLSHSPEIFLLLPITLMLFVDWASGIDRDKKTVRLAGGGTLPRPPFYRRVSVVDGAVPGWDLSAQNRSLVLKGFPNVTKTSSGNSMKQGGTHDGGTT